ncbi:OsmC family protein [Lelliottia amnigena]|uniref:OsmC family protein n=1 Tax=Lelliottia amnigena TaxID=61646 RepID=UPI002090914E|nr:OsmC family protein [Lelliottia amnigena]USR62394.1 OsmC family protein [Lelliottia amnigena]
MQIQTAHYDLVTTWRGSMASRTLCQSFSADNATPVMQSHVIDSDEPVSLGGEGLAPDPQELMLAAFNACMMAAFIQEARACGIALKHLEIHTDGHLPKGIPATGLQRRIPAGFSMSFTSAVTAQCISLKGSISG